MKALALISGGLDSTLAARLIQKQDIEIIGVNFEIPFGAVKKEALSHLGIEIKYLDIKEEFLELLKNPRYGFGANMNPCIDCKIFMLQKAKGLMQEFGASFIITGEVLGQRPMSQNKPALKLIEKRAGLEGILLRPLSTKLLDETIPEREDWVSRDKLLNFSGRTRKPQMALAKELKISEYPNPAGGCLLTDPEFAKRLKEMMAHQELTLNNVELLKVGRHFRIAANTKLVVGRDEKENTELLNLVKEGDYLFFPTDKLAGPTCLGRGEFNDELIKLSCSITCRYCDLNGATCADIVYRIIPKKEDRVLNVFPLEEAKFKSLRI